MYFDEFSCFNSCLNHFGWKVLLLSQVKTISLSTQNPRTGHNFRDKAVFKLKISKNVFNKKCGPKLLFSTEIFLSKILMYLDKKIFLEVQFWQFLTKPSSKDLQKHKMIHLLVICNTWASNFDYPSLLYFTLNYSNATVQ